MKENKVIAIIYTKICFHWLYVLKVDTIINVGVE